MPVASFFLALFLGIDAKQEFGISFYETAAQVIPVLLLVLAIELRMFDSSFPDPDDPDVELQVRFKPVRSLGEFLERLESPRHLEFSSWMLRFSVLAGMVAAEVVAFRVIAYDAPSRVAQGVVFGSIIAALVMIVLVAVRRYE